MGVDRGTGATLVAQGPLAAGSWSWVTIGVGVTGTTFENGFEQVGDAVRRNIHLVEIVGDRCSGFGREGSLNSLSQPQRVLAFDQHVQVELPPDDVVVLEVERNIDASDNDATAQAGTLQPLVDHFAKGFQFDVRQFAQGK